MKAVKISDEAWEYVKQLQVKLAIESGVVESISSLVSKALLNNVLEVKP